MSDEKKYPKAYEDAARAVHENYYGAGSWKKAGTPERSHARQSVRLAIAAFEKHGLIFQPKSASVAGKLPPRPPVAVPRRS